MESHLELISFKLCPFVQRSVILLEEKQVKYTLTYIDLNDKPDWFLKISPMGKVPVLKVDNEVLFESSVINEFLDEYQGRSLHPDDLIQKAKHRAWIELSSSLVFDLIKVLQAKNELHYEEEVEQFRIKLQKVESQINGAFFGDSFQLVDIAFAPILLRMHFVAKRIPNFLAEFAKITQWTHSVIERESVKRSYAEDLESIFIQRFQSQGSYLLGSEKKNRRVVSNSWGQCHIEKLGKTRVFFSPTCWPHCKMNNSCHIKVGREKIRWSLSLSEKQTKLIKIFFHLKSKIEVVL